MPRIDYIIKAVIAVVLGVYLLKAFSQLSPQAKSYGDIGIILIVVGILVAVLPYLRRFIRF